MPCFLAAEKPSAPITKPSTIPAQPPGTNIWEERKKKMQVEAERTSVPSPPPLSATFVPTEEDKKRTLRETAPKLVEEKAPGLIQEVFLDGTSNLKKKI